MMIRIQKEEYVGARFSRRSLPAVVGRVGLTYGDKMIPYAVARTNDCPGSF